jgi:hypothetical protein
MADLARQLFPVDCVLWHTISATNDIGVTIGTRWRFCVSVAVGVHGTITVEFLNLVTADAGHTTLHPVDVTLYTLVLALVLRTRASAVAGEARVFDRCHFFERVTGDQSATGECGATDMALTTGRVAACTMVSERLSHLGIAKIGTASLKHRFVPVDRIV